MAWTSISSTQTDADSPLDQTLMDAIRTNLDDLNTRLDAIGVVSEQNIYDDFTSTAFLTRVIVGGGAIGHQDPYTWDLAGTGLPTLAANPNHYAVLTQAGGAADFSALVGSDYKIAFDLSQDHTVVFECRHKSSQSDITESWAFGFQDAAIAITSVNTVKDLSDFLGFIQGTGVANTYRAQTASGGATTVVVDDSGSAAAWTILRIEVTFSGATQQVEFFINGTSVGTSITTITTVRLRPVVGNADGAGARTQNFDYVNAYWASRPLNP